MDPFMDYKPIPVKRKVLEKHVEAYLIKRVKALGGISYKWSSMNVRGVADRVVIFPGGWVYFVELKRDKSCPMSKHQKIFFDTMASLNMEACVCLHGKEEVDSWIESLA